ncbi:IS5 family transposase [Halomonas piscis]|uniref:IS5 family transposase n=4 Tax=Halomonas TaxID=2745 RepID=A0ABY9YY69_9GAMM|nr:IS5 family transposase [Halomonas piscis]WNK19427.1 IS5 family transposase [Halomonas piscis]WNK19472.1 IS5 family transposase [Halomonas piscis]WNK19522.1 IS5 family transposase [Halomonas piscis]WNK19523.1 IS5 family transposase [Halomonas piscis]WNK19524.1 IS5 family transposase [Halomonas piscis]
MSRLKLRDDQWERIEHLLPGKASDCGVTAKDNRLFVEAVLWIARTGAPWRDLPESFGRWHTVYMRYNRWSRKGVWQRIFDTVADDPDLEQLMIDGSIVRVHQHGASKKNTQDVEAMGKSRGGLSTKIHAAVDALGNPVRLVLTPGQASEYGAAPALLEGFSPQAVLGDKGYDSTALRDMIQAAGAEPVIPPKKNRLARIEVDWHCYQDRNLVERFFQKIKKFRRLSTRYERLARNYQSLLCLVSAAIWLA